MLKLALTNYFKKPTDYLKRMVAAYVIGYFIATDDLNVNSASKFAEEVDNTGVIVSWDAGGLENMLVLLPLCFFYCPKIFFARSKDKFKRQI